MSNRYGCLTCLACYRRSYCCCGSEIVSLPLSLRVWQPKIDIFKRPVVWFKAGEYKRKRYAVWSTLCVALWNEMERKDEFKLRTEILNTSGWTKRSRLGTFELSHIIVYVDIHFECVLCVLTHQSACMHIIIMCSAYACVWVDEWVSEWLNKWQTTESQLNLFISLSFRFVFVLCVCFHVYFFFFGLLLSDESRTFSLTFFRSTNQPFDPKRNLVSPAFK